MAEIKTLRLSLTGIAPLQFSRAIVSTKKQGESHSAFEDRVWRERLHVADNGQVFIPPQSLKLCLSDVARYLSETVPGKGKATFTKHFEAGIMVVEPLLLSNDKGKPIMAGDIEELRLFVPSDGKKGGGSRVWKSFPMVRSGWTTSAEIIVLDPTLQSEFSRIMRYAEHAGQFIGMLAFRPRNGGYFGRFTVKESK